VRLANTQLNAGTGPHQVTDLLLVLQKRSAPKKAGVELVRQVVGDLAAERGDRLPIMPLGRYRTIRASGIAQTRAGRDIRSWLARAEGGKRLLSPARCGKICA